jgi:predicted MPP superfamily phosphohydrolase
LRITRYHFDLNYKIAILSDVHNKAFDLAVLENEKVDLILIPGDICSEHLSEEAWEHADKDKRSIVWKYPDIALNLFQELPNIAPTFYSIGNHECRWNEYDKQIVRESGTVLLDNEYYRFKDMVIGGISSIPKELKENSDNTYINIMEGIIGKMKKEEGKKILLLHEPQLYDKYRLQEQPVDLVVSGHAHGGQWRFFGHGVFAPGQGIFPKYTKGFYNGNLLVSAGMTNTAPVPRIFNPTEIVIVGK